MARYGTAAKHSVMERLKRWGRRLLGAPPSMDGHRSGARHAAPGDAAKPVTSTKRPAAPGELTIAADPPAKPKVRSGRAGFDPYSSDAGYSKPRGWDRVDHD